MTDKNKSPISSHLISEEDSEGAIKVVYEFFYYGYMEITTSMKSLNVNNRYLVAKECINKVHDEALKSLGIQVVDDKSRKADEDEIILKHIGKGPFLKNAIPVKMIVTITRLTIISINTNQVFFSHDVAGISFISAGDSKSKNFIAFVSKDSNNIRLCYVLECGDNERAHDVVTTIGQVFDFRYRCIKTNSSSVSNTLRENNIYGTAYGLSEMKHKESNDDQPPPVPPRPTYVPSKNNSQSLNHVYVNNSIATSEFNGSNQDKCTYVDDSKVKNENNYLNSNEHTRVINSRIMGKMDKLSLDNSIYVNSSTTQFSSSKTAVTNNYLDLNDPKTGFDVKKSVDDNDYLDLNKRNKSYDPSLDEPCFALNKNYCQKTDDDDDDQNDNVKLKLQDEIWFHGNLPRNITEELLKHNGDFLVRESQGKPGKYVISGIQGNQKKHILLETDINGYIKTKTNTFQSISQFINLHIKNKSPIVSDKMSIILVNPVPRTKF